MRLLEYRLYEDLRRGWRVIQPNLEQCGLLTIEYPGLEALCENDALWAGHPILQAVPAKTRLKAVRAFLDHLRKEMAVDARVLDPAEEWELRQRVLQSLMRSSRHLSVALLRLRDGLHCRLPTRLVASLISQIMLGERDHAQC